jgi:hypothetical protein
VSGIFPLREVDAMAICKMPMKSSIVHSWKKISVHATRGNFFAPVRKEINGDALKSRKRL